MVLPPEIFMAARNGDSGIVDAYLSLAGGAAHDINERLRSLMLRGRAKPRRGVPNVVARTFKLPNEMVWKVLAFWRVESEVTGEVI